MFYIFIKRSIDIIFSIIILFLFIPLWIIIPLLIKIDSHGRIIFKQKRAGLDSRYFTIYKFRTMKEGTPDIPTDEIENQEILNTKLGTFLRRTSLDEIPQIINILKGDMSVIGPRPALYNQDLLIRLRQERGVDKVRPGVGGLAQVRGRDDLSIPEKVEYDSLYVKNLSFFLDTKIFLLTIKSALTGKGAN